MEDRISCKIAVGSEVGFPLLAIVVYGIVWTSIALRVEVIRTEDCKIKTELFASHQTLVALFEWQETWDVIVTRRIEGQEDLRCLSVAKSAWI